MGDKTEIGWCNRQLPDGKIIEGKTFNGWWGCFKVSPGCKFCYAEGTAKHWGHDVWGPAETTPRRILSAENWSKPLKWNKEAEKLGHRVSVFASSMADVYEDHPDLMEPRRWLWKIIENTPWLNWLLLTKRPENIKYHVPMRWWLDGTKSWPGNVWVGTSVEDQQRADERLPYLCTIPAPVRFVSYEPALGPVDFSRWTSKLQWIICGGESGAHHRPFDLEWPRSARNQVLSARLQGYDIRFFFKQVGGITHSAGGRLLDGRTWDEMPEEFPPELSEYDHIPSFFPYPWPKRSR